VGKRNLRGEQTTTGKRTAVVTLQSRDCASKTKMTSVSSSATVRGTIKALMRTRLWWAAGVPRHTETTTIESVPCDRSPEPAHGDVTITMPPLRCVLSVQP